MKIILFFLLLPISLFAGLSQPKEKVEDEEKVINVYDQQQIKENQLISKKIVEIIKSNDRKNLKKTLIKEVNIHIKKRNKELDRTKKLLKRAKKEYGKEEVEFANKEIKKAEKSLFQMTDRLKDINSIKALLERKYFRIQSKERIKIENKLKNITKNDIQTIKNLLLNLTRVKIKNHQKKFKKEIEKVLNVQKSEVKKLIKYYKKELLYAKRYSTGEVEDYYNKRISIGDNLIKKINKDLKKLKSL